MYSLGWIFLAFVLTAVATGQEFNCTFEGSNLCGWTQSTIDSYDLVLDSRGTSTDNTGPRYDHTIGDTSGTYLYREASDRNNGPDAVLLSPEVAYIMDQVYCFMFWYNMFGKGTGSLSVYAYPTDDGHNVSSKQPLFSISGQQTGQHAWLRAQVDVSNQTSNFTVAVELATIGFATSDMAIDDVELWLTDCPTQSTSFNCSFDDGPCGWTQSTDDDYNWALERERTRTGHTGPRFDHTIGDATGLFYYAEGNGPSVNDKAVLLSPNISGSLTQDSWCFSFWYNMYGRDIASLHAYVIPAGQSTNLGTQTPAFSVTGQQTGQRVWIEALVDATNQTSDFMVALEAVAGSADQSDIAIDDVAISPGPCTRDTDLSFNCNFEQGYCGWTQSTDDDVNLALERGQTYSSSTGPSFDHTLGNEDGTYLYFEGNGGSGSAIVISPVVSTFNGSRIVVSFWYNMYGTDIGNLTAYVTTESGNVTEGYSVFSLSGQQTDGTTWLQAVIPLTDPPSTFRIALEVTGTTGFRADTAVDDIEITFIDIEAPEVTCPNSVPSMSTDVGLSTAVVTWSPLPSATDNMDVFDSSNITCKDDGGNLVESNGTYALGPTTVTCNATDMAGNQGFCNFSITIIDTEAPNVTCPSSIPSMTTDAGLSTAMVIWSPLPSATDNVDVFDSSNITCKDNSGNVVESNGTYALGPTTVTCNATDMAGNQGICNFSITIIDTEAPVIEFCPQNVVNETTEATFSSTWTPPNATDNSDPAENITILASHNPGDNFTAGTITEVKYIFIDTSNNSAVCIFNVTVNDIGDPVFLTCPDRLVFTLAQGQDRILVNFAIPIVEDNSGEVIVPVSDPQLMLPTDFSYGETSICYNATDSSGNRAVPCVFTVVVHDEEDPKFTVCPQSPVSPITTDPNSNTANYSWVAPKATDNVAVMSVDSSHTSPAALPIRNNTITYTATDPAGNTGICEFYVTIIDVEPPTVSRCPADIINSTDPGLSNATVYWQEPTFRDNDGLSFNTSTHSPGDPFGVGNTTVTYNVTDISGNVAHCSFLVTIEDNEVPTFVNCTEVIRTGTAPGKATKKVTWATLDYRDNVGIDNIVSSHNSGDTFGLGNVTVTISVSDEAQNTANCSFVVTVIDDEPPSFKACPADIINSTDAGLNSSVVYWQEPTITDNVGVVANYSSHSPGDVFPVGNTTVIYIASDSAGNTNNCLFSVSVEDDEPPELLCPVYVVNSTDAHQNSSNVFWQEPIFTDNVGIVSNESSHRPGDVFPLGNITVTYSVSDKAGNVANCSFIVSVEDNEAPNVMNCPADVVNSTMANQSSAFVYWREPSFSDNVGVVSRGNSHSPGDVFPFGNTTVTYTASDAAGNVRNCSFIVTVQDNEAPTVSNCPADLVNGTDPSLPSSVVYWQEPTFSDNVAIAINESNLNPGDVFPVGNTTVIYSVSDSSGNTVNCSFIVTVKDTEAPMFSTCSSVTIEVDPGQATSMQEWMFPVATDNVAVTRNSSTQQRGGSLSLGVHEVTYVVYDAAGNNNTCVFEIIVEDNEMPNITNCPMDVTLNTTRGRPVATYSFPTPVCIDNAGSVTVTTSKLDDEYSIDDTTVIIACLDETGNTDTCTFTVTVQ
ncbi:hyalin-like, partial [Acanthaster planci]|uniref:Hyalin-like n=1 Tax=Acanthaster planci TaxID=133434 RepID=A0A8B7Y364_ACAPL